MAVASPRKWTRRRLLRWALGGASLAAVGGWVASRRRQEPRRIPTKEELEEGLVEDDAPSWTQSEKEEHAAKWIEEAAPFCYAGHEGASVNLSMALKAAPDYAPARLMSACWFMHTGRWDLVQEDLSFPSIRDTPEGQLLRSLAERRPRSPDWRHAFFDAWVELGRPDFHDSPLLPAPIRDHDLFTHPQRGLSHTTGPQRLPLLILSLPLGEPTAELLEHARASTSVPLLFALREQLLPTETQTLARQSLLTAVEARLAQLSTSAPRTLQLALVSFLAGKPSTAPFTREELEALEPLVALPAWKHPSSGDVFQELYPLFDTWLAPPGHHALLLASTAQALSLGQTLLERGRASRAHLPEGSLRLLGRLLWEAGARLRAQPSHTELDLGLRLQMFGSELTGHSPTREECLGAWVELGRWEEALARAAYARWPLAALHEEACAPRAHDEPAWLRAFLPGGSLP